MSSNIKNPKKIGNYSIGDIIGKGAMGCVYKGINLETGLIVAIKQVTKLNRFQYKILKKTLWKRYSLKLLS